MSKPINVTALSNHLLKQSHVVDLILSIFQLEKQIEHPDEQSEYFRWAIKGHWDHMRQLENDYERIRAEFNRADIDELIATKAKSEEFLLRVAHISPLIARHFAQVATYAKIHRVNEYLQLKSSVAELPGLDELRSHPDLLLKIMT